MRSSHRASSSRILYPTSGARRLTPAVFRNPPAEYRGAPFWSWNGKLERAHLMEQLRTFKEMGMGGAHIHVRVGLEDEYLGETFMGHVKASVEEAKRLGARIYLYDEDRWPSGSAGGIVTKDERFRTRMLVLQPEGVPLAVRCHGTPQQVARYAIRLAADGSLASWKRLPDHAAVPRGHVAWVALNCMHGDDSFFNGNSYVDTMNPEAIQAFVASTYERYKAAVGDEFGKAVPSIFTDEPQYSNTEPRRRSDDSDALLFAWTDDLPKTFRATHGFDLLDSLPELAWDGPESYRVRWAYFDHLSERFTTAFAGTIGDWCERNGILMTGHLMNEQTLYLVTAHVGDAMRTYPSMHIPGMDLLRDDIELGTALQCRSVARQDGREGVMSELYGVTRWDFDFIGHKRQGDWQAALGVTLRVHHLSWVNMGGESKRDYPAPIDAHSPWWRRYNVVEDHFSRVNTAMTRGEPICRVAVVHPIESFWPLHGPTDRNGTARIDAERRYQEIMRWLLHGLIDHDFLCEALLPGQAKVCGKRLQVGKMAYDAVVLPNLSTIRATTLRLLQEFAAAGGRVIVMGETPTHLDAKLSHKPAAAARRWTRISWDRAALHDILADLREVDFVLADGNRPETLLYQLRRDGELRHLFLCTLDRDSGTGPAVLRLRGNWDVTLLDTLDGSKRRLSAEHRAEHRARWTLVRADLPAAGSLLLQLAKAKKRIATPVSFAPVPCPKVFATLPESTEFTLDEPNVLLLDRAEFSWDGGDWEPANELLRINNELRIRQGLPTVNSHMVQPWAAPRPAPTHTVRVRFALDLAVPVKGAKLALERASDSRLWIDGVAVKARPEGYWVGRALSTIPLPDLAPGQRILEVEQPVGPGTMLEWMYLLGDFGVEVTAARAKVIAAPRTLSWGDWTTQGLPFYAGNVTYRCPIITDGKPLALRAPRFHAPLLEVALDGKPVTPMAFPPFVADLSCPAAGTHELALTAYGSRVNAFGPLHDATHLKVFPVAPGAWRTTGDKWSWPWRLTPCGVFAAPELIRPT